MSTQVGRGRPDSLRLAPRRLPAVVDCIDLSTGARQPWKKLMLEDPAGVVAIDTVVVSRDDLSYAYSYSRAAASDFYAADGLYK